MLFYPITKEELSRQGPSVIESPPRPLERLEAEIVELAGQLTAATARFITLLSEFDAAEGWGDWGMRSTAQWLSWKCGIGRHTAQEQVRVARTLRRFPLLQAAFAEARLTYSKVRAITRFVAPATEADVVEMAEYMTAAQLERLAGTCRRVRRLQDVQARHDARHVTWRWDDDGSLVGTFRLPPEDGLVFVQALHAAQDRRQEPKACDGEAEKVPAGTVDKAKTANSNADALVDIAAQWLVREQLAHPNQAERYQVMLHTSAEALVSDDDEESAADSRAQIGPGLPAETTRRLTCDCAVVDVVDEANGNPLHVGRKTRRIGRRLRRALSLRDRGRCRAPGCESRAKHIHHIRHWAYGGTTCLTNLISLCEMHHWLVHEGGWTIATPRGRPIAWFSPDGRRLDESPPPQKPSELLAHDPTIPTDAATGRWVGDPMHLDYVVSCIFTTEDLAAQRAAAQRSPNLN